MAKIERIKNESQISFVKGKNSLVFSFWWLILQGCVFIVCIAFGMHLLSMHDDKQRQYEILFERNKKEFYPESFSIYMDAPCGRKVVRAVLKDLNKSHEYKNLLKYKTQ